MGGLLGEFDFGREHATGENRGPSCENPDYRGEPVSWRGPGASITAFAWPWEEVPLAVSGSCVAAVHGLLFGRGPGTSAERLLQGFLAGGADFFRRCDGDMAFMLWDGRERTLYLGRDTFGSRPLFHTRTGTRVCAASDVGRIRPGNPPAQDSLDGPVLLSWLDLAPVSIERTAFSGVNRVLPSHVEIFGPGGRFRRLRVWEPPRQVDWRLTPEAVAEEIPTVIRRSLERRRWHRPVVALSGGLDSTSVAAVACRDPGVA